MSRTIHAANWTIAILAALALAGPARAQSRDDKLSMPNVSIEGERQTPDIFFVFPTGKGGNVSAPRYRDYGPDILAPVVKPWFERDMMVDPVTAHVTGEDKIDLDEVLKASPASRDGASAPAESLPQAPPVAFSPRSAPSIPASARSLPSSAEPSIPSTARSLPSSATPGMLGAPSSSEPAIPTAARSLPSGAPPSTLAFPPSSPAAVAPATRPMPSSPPGGYGPMHDPADGYVPPPN